MSPRYDVPKQAPEPLVRVQQFLNSVDLENEVDWLPAWLDERGLGGELERARGAARRVSGPGDREQRRRRARGPRSRS